MKEKIMYLILGILIGAVITAGCFLVFSKSSSQGMNGGSMPEMPSGDMMGGGDGNGERPSDMPDGNTVAPSDGTTAPQTSSSSDTTDQNS